MATSGSISDPYSSRTQFSLKLSVSRSAVDGLRAKWAWTLVASPVGNWYALDPAPWEVRVEGHKWTGTHNLDMRGGPVQIASGETGWITQSAGATRTINMFFSHGPLSVFGTASKSGSFVSDALTTVPNAPTTPAISEIAPTQMRTKFSTNGNGGVSVDQWQLQYSTSPSFTSPTTLNVSTGNNVVTGLTPNTTYYFRARGHNTNGWGAWSGTGTGKTLTASAPTLASVTPALNGKSATLAITLPAGVSTVSSYNIFRRTPGGTWTKVKSGSANPSQSVGGLTPGQTYQWRVTALLGTYETAVSNTVSAVQPQPNTSPGAYFDGNTPDSSTTNYAWVGAAGSSSSTATTLAGGAVGWLTGAEAVAESGGSAISYQVDGGLDPDDTSGTHAVQYVVTATATDNGFRAGTDGDDGYADVTVGGSYMGSIWVQPSRGRSLAAMIVWYNDSAVEVGTTPGSEVALVANEPARLTVLGEAPAGATRAAVVATDLPGSEMFEVSDGLLVDQAMVSIGVLYPYFDGGTVDTSLHRYEWDGPALESPSYREDIPQDEVDPLQDPDCDPIPVPPRPPAIEDDCITPVGSWRRTWYIIPAVDIPSWLSAVPSVTLGTFDQPERQVRIRWYENSGELPPLDFDSSTWSFEQTVSFIPANSLLTIDGVAERVWAEVPAGSDPIPADHLLYGTNGAPVTWPLLSCGVSWLVSLDTPLDSDPGNLSVAAGLTVRT